jgi:XTP/dITP diphosphohydrolase
MDIYLASGNRNKQREISEILSSHRILLPADIGVAYEADETGPTFLDNALIKARALYTLIQKPVLADDSGLVVPALGGEPGVYSARYGSKETGRELPGTERNALLLERMRGITERAGFFVCCMVLYLSDVRFFIVQETLEGVIALEPRGTGGFGYDPIVYLPPYQKTVAELDPEEKNRISHRGKACKGIERILTAV